MLGIDIADEALRVLELQAPSRMLAFAQVALPQGIVVNEQLRKPVELAAAIRHLCSAAAIRSRRVALAVPTPQLLTHRMALPAALDDDEIRELLIADPHWQGLTAGISVHYDFIAAQDAAEQRELRVFAAARAEIDARCEAVQLAGLQAMVVDVEAFALEAAASALAPSEPACALLHFNRERSSLLVVHEGATIHLQSLSGSRTWLDEHGHGLQERLRIWSAGLRAMLHSAPQQLLMAGACADADALATMLAEMIGLPCAPARLPGEMTARRAGPQAMPGEGVLAYGLALRGLDAPQ